MTMRSDWLGLLRGAGPVQGLLISDTLMVLAYMVGQVVVPWWIAREGGSWQLTVTAVLQSCVTIAMMPLLSPLSDRYPKRQLIAWSLVGMGIAACGMAFMASLGTYWFQGLVAMQTVVTVALAVITPATSTIAADLVPASKLPNVLALQQGAQSTGRLIGPVVGGVLFAAIGLAGTLWTQMALLLVAALAALRMSSLQAVAASTRSNWWFEVRAGLRATWAIPMERSWLALNSISWVFLFPMFSMLLPLKVQSLGLSVLWLGLCEAALAVGILTGTLGVSQLIVRWWGRYAARLGAAIVQSVSLGVAGWTDDGPILLACLFLAGLTNAAMFLIGMTHRVLARPVAFRGRISGCGAIAIQVATGLGPAVAGVLLSIATVDVVYVAFAVAAGTVSIGFAFVPGIRAFLALEPEAVENLYQRNHPEVFKTKPY